MSLAKKHKRQLRNFQRSQKGVGEQSPAPVAVKRGAKPDPRYLATDGFYTRWLAGEQLAALALEAGIKRSKFRRVLIQHAGGKAAFAKCRSEGAGGRAQRGANLANVQRSVSDDGVKFLKNVGWTDRNVWLPKMVRIKVKDAEGRSAPLTVPWRECAAKVFVSPKGNEYVRALPSEPADARIRVWLGEMESIVRLKRYTGSKVERKVEAATADAEQLAAKVAHIQERDRTKRVVRRKARLTRKRRTR